MIGIIGAMQSEIDLLCDALRYKLTICEGSFQFYKGVLFGKEVVIVKSGVGKVNAALATQALIYCFNPKVIINTGIAGSLDKELCTYDFALASSTVYHDVDATFFGYKKGQIPQMSRTINTDRSYVQLFEKVLGQERHNYKVGLIASGDIFVADDSVKESIREEFSPICVDMESCAIAHTCSLNEKPCVILRCISDCADKTASATYEFNEDKCAGASADVVKKVIAIIGE